MPDTLQTTLAERGRSHGEFRDHATLTQTLKRHFDRLARTKPAITGAESAVTMNDIEREAVDMILHKLGRIGSGNPHFKDHWIDIAGYAQLVADRLP